jgi:hypothetical protein
MDQEIRNKLRNVVTQCRKLLEDSVSQELEGKYAIFAKKDQVTADPNATMAHLTDEEKLARKDILDHFSHIKARGFKPKEALDQLVREIAFTHLNRLCAYRMMEAREVYIGGQKFRESVSRGVNSNGVKFYLAEHEEDERLFNTGQQDVAYRHFLDWLGRLLSEEIGVLFNTNDPANRLYPRQKTLDEVLDLLNGGGIKAEETELREQWPQIWSQDETIGWVYQYFTPKELRDQARKESQAPRNSYELAFRNQFFTPRYVVEFLTDNTLGRIWYEMRKGDTRLKDQCRYMVRRPTEIFLKEGEQPPKDAAEWKEGLSQEELLKLPVYIPQRPKKDPRELKILDPACGSGHFLLYCFDLLLTIYEESYADPDLGPALQNDYPALDALKRDVPRLILAHNLHGIDIDLRASQIAALALWLRCQRAYQEMGLKKDRPKITRSNFVCAEPMPGEEQMLKEFVSQFEPKVLGQVVEVVFKQMKLAGEVGSLLRIEEEIRDAVATAKKQYIRETTQAKDKKGRTLLFTEAEMDRVAEKPRQPSFFDLSDISDEHFFEQAELQVIHALRFYAENADHSEHLRRQLFTEDSVRGFAFVDLCRKHFSVILMNPPFGESTKNAKEYIATRYARTKHDLYTSFVERALSQLHADGYMGAITSRTGFFLSTFQKWREELILADSAPTVFADLGYGVLDTAMVETSSFCLRKGNQASGAFFRILAAEDKSVALKNAVGAFTLGEGNGASHVVPPASFALVPGSPFAYWLTESLRRRFRDLPKFESAERVLRIGDHPGDGFRWLRIHNEIPYRDRERSWLPYHKGGTNSPFFDDVPLVVDWDPERQTYRDFHGRKGRPNERPSNYQHFLKPGITFPYLPHKRGHFAHVPPGGIFGHASPILQLPHEQHWAICALLNSDAYIGLLHSLMPRGGVGGGQTLKYEVGYVRSVPIPSLDALSCQQLTELAKEAYALRYKSEMYNEIRRLFVVPSLTEIPCASLKEGIFAWEEREAIRLKRLEEIGESINDLAFELYHIRGSDRQLLVESLRSDVGFSSIVQTEDEELDEEAQLCEGAPKRHVSSLISYFTGCIVGRWDIRYACGQRPLPEMPDPFEPLPPSLPGMLQDVNGLPLESAPTTYPIRIDCDGIIPDDPDHAADDIIRRLREVLELNWKWRSDAIEKEACEILGIRELRDYFRKPGRGGFWDDHISRYSKSRRKAPIYWLLQSSKKNYALWLYYHRIDKDLLFKALVNYVEPKIRLETSRLESLRTQKAAVGESGKEAKRLAKEVERQEDFLSELRDFEDKLRRAANLHLEPDLNDGVVLNIAPLHELVPWKEAKKYWDELLKGEYEWSSIGKQLRQRGLVK